MKEYGKTENLLKRDPDTHKLIPGELRLPEFGIPGKWLVTEKVDGTNIRVIFDCRRAPSTQLYSAEVRGRSDRANVPGDLTDSILNALKENSEGVHAWLAELGAFDEPTVVCLYGEGYGAGIQKGGGDYRSDKWLRLFDVTTTRFEYIDGDRGPDIGYVSRDTWWRDWPTVVAASRATGFPTVPVLDAKSTIGELLIEVAQGFASVAAAEDDGCGCQAEGIVARTDPYIYNWRGSRVIFKLKTADLA